MEQTAAAARVRRRTRRLTWAAHSESGRPAAQGDRLGWPAGRWPGEEGERRRSHEGNQRGDPARAAAYLSGYLPTRRFQRLRDGP